MQLGNVTVVGHLYFLTVSAVALLSRNAGLNLQQYLLRRSEHLSAQALLDLEKAGPGIVAELI
jgi:hypothetical protein